jgi:endogenous inhibitor of DNA gyrase (YacG/DUF329 family)
MSLDQIRQSPAARACPICGKPAVERFRPFCSARCADHDLHRWLGEVYRIESDDIDAGDEKNETQGVDRP